MLKAMNVLLAFALGIFPLSAGAQGVPPEDGALLCAVKGSDVYLEWNIVFLVPIAGFSLARDGVEIAFLDPGATNYVDQGVPSGGHVYTLAAIQIDGTAAIVGRCAVTVPGSPVRCAVFEQTVHIEWDPPAITVYVHAFAITRNGDLIAMVPGDQFFYDDTVPTVGKFTYKVAAVVSSDTQLPVGSCEVDVECFGLTAFVDGLSVSLKWEFFPPLMDLDGMPILIDPTFFIVRDGEHIGATKEMGYLDTVPAPGEYLYEVYVDLGTGGIPVYLFAACRVAVPGIAVPPPADLTCTVIYCMSPICPMVRMEWRNPVPYDWIGVLFDGEFLGRIDGSANSYDVANAPPGIHVYGIFGIQGNVRSFPAKCEVAIEPFPAPPQDLRCTLYRELDPSEPPPCDRCPVSVLLTWVNGDAYDLILVMRDDLVLDTLAGGPAGETREYRDWAPPQGEHLYCVVGIAGGSRSAACCDVIVPGTFPPPPADLTCIFVVDPGPVPVDPNIIPPPQGFVFLEWKNPVDYEGIIILRNDMLIASLPGTETFYRDELVVGGGFFYYKVIGIVGDLRSQPAECKVEVPPGGVPPPQDFTCFVDDIIMNPGDPDLSGNGLSAPEGDVAPFLAVILKWWNPVRYGGLIISRDQAVIAELPGDAMMYRDIGPSPGLHVYGIQGVLADGTSSPVVTCEVFVGEAVPPVEELTCVVAIDDTTDPGPGRTVVLFWKNGAVYDAILISRDGEAIAELPGDSTGYFDRVPGPGVYIYEVVGIIRDRWSLPAACQVVVPGHPPRNLLYFSSPIMEPSPDGTIPSPSIPGSRITCLANNDGEVQGWSFGVQSDPKFIVPSRCDLEDTATAGFNGGAGPAFLTLKILVDGVVMAAVIEDGTLPPFETLPVGIGNKLLNIEYAAGPSGAFDEVYRVQYSDALGDPPVQVLFVVGGFEVRPATLPGWVTIPRLKFIRGDIDGNGRLEITDPIRLLDWLFLGGKRPGCMEAADANGSLNVNIADPVYILSALYMGGEPPPWPFPDCGAAPTPLGCDDPGSCK